MCVSAIHLKGIIPYYSAPFTHNVLAVLPGPNMPLNPSPSRFRANLYVRTFIETSSFSLSWLILTDAVQDTNTSIRWGNPRSKKDAVGLCAFLLCAFASGVLDLNLFGTPLAGLERKSRGVEWCNSVRSYVSAMFHRCV